MADPVMAAPAVTAALAVTAPPSAQSRKRSWQVGANDEHPVELRGGCKVTAFDRCQITVYGDCEITAYDDCQITVFAGEPAGPAGPAGPA